MADVKQSHRKDTADHPGENHSKHQQEKAPSQGPLLAFGDPLYESTSDARTKVFSRRSSYERGGIFERLPHSAEEVEKIAEIYGISLSSDAVNLEEKATEKRLREMDLTRYHILHFATHAVVSDEVKWITQPALVLSLAGTDDTYDGFLQMSEIFNLQLDADLVFSRPVIRQGKAARAKDYWLTRPLCTPGRLL